MAYCVNRGQVFGRKDIGGIVGQAEPYIVLNLSEDMLDTIQKELDRLGGLVDRAADHADGAAVRISDNLDAIGASVDDATGHAKDLTDRLSDLSLIHISLRRSESTQRSFSSLLDGR